MGTGYTRNDTPNNIADGNVINASDLDGEFDAVQAAFNGSTGHSHDGTTGEGPQIATAGLADNAVTTAKITDANVTLAKMAANSVDSDQYVDGSIDRVHLAADIVDGTKIADDSIDSEHYVDGSIDTAHIADDAVTSAKLDTNIQIAGTLGVTGETTLTTHLNMGDNDIIKLGAGADLQIYHDSSGSHSQIKESGTGNLQIWADDLYIIKSDGSETKAQFNSDGNVRLFYNGLEKLATTSTGIDVTGTAVTDGLTVAGNVSVDGGTIKLDGNYPVGTNNVALGDQALNGSTTGSSNVALGTQALVSNTDGSQNIAVGRRALYLNTSGDDNIAIGALSLDANTSGQRNVGISSGSLGSNTTGANNTAVGYLALNNNTTASNNTAVGYSALLDNTTGTGNTALGKSAGASLSVNGNNTMIGVNAGLSTDSVQNTFIGGSAGNTITSGSKNTILGRYNGNQGSLDIRTSDNYIVLSDGDGNPRGIFDGSGNFLVGKTAPNVANVGFEAKSDGAHFMTRDDGEPLKINRKTFDGNLIAFAKDGNGRGAIGTSGNNLAIHGAGTGDDATGVMFVSSASTQRIVPCQEGFTLNDGIINLGHSSNRFKDLYLSGGVYLGGTGSANLLNYYDEGNWTPSNAGDATGTVTANGKYVIVGRLVTLHFTIRIDSNFTINRIGNLPILASQDTSLSGVHGNFTIRSDNTDLYAHVLSGTSYFQIQSNLTGTTHPPTTTDGVLRGVITYQSA